MVNNNTMPFILQKKIFLKLHLLLLYAILNLLCVEQAWAQVKQGELTGIVYDDKNNPLAGATVAVEKSGKATTSSVDGDFLVKLIPGTYIVSISSVGFETKKITEVVIKQNEQTNLSVTLTVKKGTSLDNVIVTSSAKKETASSLLRTQKNSISMMDGISAETMKKTPDNNIAQSLGRVSGVNVQGGKFVTIRGVSDRYNNVQINGSTLPSSEPNRRNFSFDIIPASLVDNVVVNKTASPDLPGEFTGGLVQVNTKDVPTKNFIELTAGTGFNTESAGKTFSGFERDKHAQLGKVNKDRLWFGIGRNFEGFKFFQAVNSTPADVALIKSSTASIPNRWQFYEYAYTPVQNYQLSGGLAKRFKNSNSVGVIAAVTYRNEQNYEEGEARSLSNYDVDAKRYKYATTIGSILNASYKTKKHRISWKNLYNLKYINQVDDRIGLNETSLRTNERRFADVTTQTNMLQTRLEGEHALSTNGFKLDWYGDDISLDREQPDSRYLLRFNNSSALYEYDFSELLLHLGGLFSSVLKEHRNNAGLNLSIPFLFRKEKELIKFGYAFSQRNADFENTGLRILAKGRAPGLNPNYAYVPQYLLVTKEAIENGDFYYNPAYSSNGSTGDFYSGEQQLHAFYGMIDFKIFKKLRLTGGIRNEKNRVVLNTAKFLSTTDSNTTKIETLIETDTYKENNWLPSVNIIYSLSNRINVRTAFSKTLSRPDFVERTFVQYYDFSDQLIIRGNEGLKLTTVKNYDLRFEYYPTGGEIVSASLFYKKFTNAVERDFQVDNPSSFVEYVNRPEADARGFELDVRKNLGFINRASKLLNRFTASFNYTYLKGTVNTGDTTLLAQDRPIQGLAPFLLNAALSYDQNRWGLNVSFNQSGRKIVNAGRDVLTQFENPRSLLDLQLSAKFFKEKMIARFNIGDMLNQPYIIYNNSGKDGEINNDPKGNAFNEELDFVSYKVKRGVNYSLSVSYKF